MKVLLKMRTPREGFNLKCKMSHFATVENPMWHVKSNMSEFHCRGLSIQAVAVIFRMHNKSWILSWW